MGKIDPFSENTIIVGDCLDIMARMPDECIDLVVTDPVYDDIETQEEMAKHLSRVLVPGGNAIIYAGHVYLDRLLPALARHLQYRWIFAERTPGADARIFYYRIFVKWKPIVWLSKGTPIRHKWAPDHYVVPRDSRLRKHPWAKNEETIDLWIRRFSVKGDLVFDPFMGSGTTAVMADRAERNFFGCELDPDYVKMALERLEKDRAGRQFRLKLEEPIGFEQSKFALQGN